MKKYSLALLAISILGITACTSKNTKEASTSNKAAVSNKSPLTLEHIPEFKNPEVNAFAKEFGSFAIEMGNAAKAEDWSQLATLTEKAETYKKKAVEMTKKMNAEERETWKAFMKQLAEKAMKTE